MDALEPQAIVDLIRQEITARRDDGLWAEAEEREAEERRTLGDIHQNYDDVKSWLQDRP